MGPGHGGAASEPSIVVHLGAHKTGTTALQRALREHDGLLRQQGWLFQGPRLGPAREAFGMLEELRLSGTRTGVERAIRSLRDAVERVLEHGQRLFISAEMLLGMPLGRPDFGREPGLYPGLVSALEPLAAAFTGMDSRAVLTIRSQPDFLESFYLQAVQMGDVLPFDQFFERLDLGSLGWGPVIEAAASLLDVDIEVVPYEHLVEGVGVTHWFAERFGIDLPEGSNRSHNASLAEPGLLAALGALPALRTPGDRRALRTHLQTPGHADGRRPRLLTTRGRSSVLAACADDNQRVFDRFVVDGHQVARRYSPDTVLPDEPDVDPIWSAVTPALMTWTAALDALAD